MEKNNTSASYINLVFEDLPNYRNLFDDSEKCKGDSIHRITTSGYSIHLLMLLTYHSALEFPYDNILRFNGEEITLKFLSTDDVVDGNYIIPVGVNQSQYDWMGDYYGNVDNDWKNIFSKLSKRYLNDLQYGTAYLMIDNSFEGYHSNDIFDYLHDGALANSISPNNIIYVTGNLNIEDNLKEWSNHNSEKTPIQVIPYSHFEFTIGNRIHDITKNTIDVIPTTHTHDIYKKKLGFDNVKLYNFLNKKPRVHRMWMYSSLLKENLLDSGIVSMNPTEHTHEIEIDGSILPSRDIKRSNDTLPIYAFGDNTNDKDFDYYMYNYNQKSTLESWISIISETHFEDTQGTCFLSEKTFKTIACQSPFMILGNKGSLKKLHNLGYKTFDDIIDESYDELEGVERINAIVQELKNWESNPNKHRHWKWLFPRLEHNFEVLKYNMMFKPPSKFFEILKLFK